LDGEEVKVPTERQEGLSTQVKHFDRRDGELIGHWEPRYSSTARINGIKEGS
jgi:hypothetical protein